MAERVFLTGGSGFVGQSVVDALLARGKTVHALSRGTAVRDDPRVKHVQGGLFDRAALVEGMRGCAAVIHLVGIIFEQPSKGATFERVHHQGAVAVMEAAQEAGVKRFVHMSALGVRPDAVSNYHKTKFAAEQALRASGLEWTIFRPSMIHGPQGEFMKMEAAWARGKKPPFLFMPYFGAGLLGRGGAGKLQPVYVEDVARAFVEAVDKPETIGEVYPLVGAGEMTWPEMHHTVAEAVTGKRKAAIAIPVWYAKLLTKVAPGALLPFNWDQVVMSQEDNTASGVKLVNDFGWTPRGFAESVNSYAKTL